MTRKFIRKFGVLKALVLLTVFSILSSNIIYIFISIIMGNEVKQFGVFMASIAPAIITPSVAYFTFMVLYKLDALENSLRVSQNRLEKINETFLSFGTDAGENINRLTALCGEVMNGTCALYNRLDKGMLYSWGQWNTPADYNPIDTPDGHICYDVIKNAGDKTLVINNLQKTLYAQTDPNVISYNLQTYFGRAVKVQNNFVGSICVVFQDNYIPDDSCNMMIEIIASAIAVEEERKQAEESLRFEREQLQSIFNSINQNIYVSDPESHEIIYVNDAFKDLLKKDPTGSICYMEFYGLESPCSGCTNKKILNDRHEPYQYEFHNLDFNKDYMIIDRIIKWPDGRDVRFEIAIDITEQKIAERERRKLEDQLKMAEKMETIGVLAGGVAHDLNNVLSGIINYPELMLMQLSEDDQLRKYVLAIQDSGRKAATIVQDLLDLARRGVAVKESVSLNTIINEYLKSPEFEKLTSFHPFVKVDANLSEKTLNILGSPVHISKTIMNLVSNAAEAIVDDGKICISTERKFINKPINGYNEIIVGEYAVLTVADNGRGISSEDIEKIFEPFYTKKKMGRSGTGLGMAVVWGTVKDHKGYIEVQSKEDKGTTFNLYFPITRKKLLNVQTDLNLQEIVGKGESVLVIDDMKEQRDIASVFLSELGYTVNTVENGEKAIQYLRKNSADLLLLDMVLEPGMDGLDTYKQICELHPKQKAIIVSGYSENNRVKEAQKLGAGRYVKKPYSFAALGSAIREELSL